MHTAGPWHRNIRANGRYPVVFSGRNNHIATVSQQANPAETEANIDLIAAAPDLLAACQAALLRDDIAADELGDKLRTAVNKATGAKP